MSFFKNPELQNDLKEIQIGARLRVVNWTKAGKVAPGVLQIFEDSLYRIYKPRPPATDYGEQDRELQVKKTKRREDFAPSGESRAGFYGLAA